MARCVLFVDDDADEAYQLKRLIAVNKISAI